MFLLLCEYLANRQRKILLQRIGIGALGFIFPLFRSR
jgi:hypothetical protein